MQVHFDIVGNGRAHVEVGDSSVVEMEPEAAAASDGIKYL